MKRQFTGEEIKELVRAARVYAPDFSEELFRAMVESQSRLADDGSLETVRGMMQLERELGVSSEQVAGKYKELVKKLPEMEATVVQRQQQLQVLNTQIQQAGQELTRIREDVGAAERVKEQLEKDIAAAEVRAERERKRLALEVDRAREEAHLDKKEIASTSQLDAELKRRGLSVEFVATVCQEIPNDPETRGRLAAAIQRNGSLAADIAAMEKRLSQRQTELADIEKRAEIERNNLWELTRQREYKEKAHGFYRRYQGVGGLMEYLAAWEGMVFCHCQMCGARFWVEKKQPGLVNFQRSYFTCPCCGAPFTELDQQSYRAAGVVPSPPGVVKILLGG